MSTVLVTGAAGFVGGHLLELLEQEDDLIMAWLRPGTEPTVIGKRVGWLAVEMHDRNAVHLAIKQIQPSAVYHLAGVPHVGDSWAHTHETFAGNVLATHYLFDALRLEGLAPARARHQLGDRLRAAITRDRRVGSGQSRTVRTAPVSWRRRWSRAGRGKTMAFPD